jgi:hypothetical protein
VKNLLKDCLIGQFPTYVIGGNAFAPIGRLNLRANPKIPLFSDMMGGKILGSIKATARQNSV